MTVLLDTDIFCKLGAFGLFDDALEILGCSSQDCRRLPSLVPMLTKGGLREHYGAAVCDALIPIALKLPVIGQAPSDVLQRFVEVQEIGAGEAQLFAGGAVSSDLMLTGDKRAVRAVRGVDGMAGTLSGRCVVLEALLIALCSRLGVNEVRRRVAAHLSLDGTISNCFRPTNADPLECLESYLNDLQRNVAPLILWFPE